MLRQKMPISRLWLQGALLTYLVGFTILGILAYLTYTQQPPIPAAVKSVSGEILFTRGDIFDGMDVFRRYGLMEYGSVYGHGAYLGPDFTADYLHRSATILFDDQKNVEPSDARGRVAVELHDNTYNPETNTVTWSHARSEAHVELLKYYEEEFSSHKPAQGLQADLILDRNDIRTLTAFFAWTSWTATANRPHQPYSYTNNWPPDSLAGNSLTGDAVLWSALSIITLLGGTGLVLFFFGRYDWLGWTDRKKPVSFRDISKVPVTPAQRALVWFFVAASVFFLIQTLVDLPG
jgi:nitric oxide reductase subunit B